MMMANKTKAALQVRQCNYKKLKPSQITTLIDQVNNLGRVANMQLDIAMQRGQAKRCDKKCNGYKLTAPLAQLVRDIRKSAHTDPNYESFVVLPSGTALVFLCLSPLSLRLHASITHAEKFCVPSVPNAWVICSSSWWGNRIFLVCVLLVCGFVGIKKSIVLFVNPLPRIKKGFDLVQPFGSMPSFCKRWRHASLTQELNWPCPAVFSICPNSSSSNRIVRRVLLLRSYGFLLLSSCIGSNHYVSLLVNGANHSKRGLTKKQRPAVLRTHAGRLTTNDR